MRGRWMPPSCRAFAHCSTASWTAFDATAEAAAGHELRKGPRGGGRDLDKIVATSSRRRRRTSR